MKTIITRLLTAGALLLAMSHGFAADFAPSTSAAPDKLAAARAQIAAKNWPAAITELKRVNDTGNADWNNLMGYSLRRSSPPDYPAAERYYNEALRIDPRHKGALEYSGELYLILGRLEDAEKRLAPHVAASALLEAGEIDAARKRAQDDAKRAVSELEQVRRLTP